ncbi:MAG: selenocysteine-specific translation elongation factor [Synergistaceae bacterium]|nr:selenocysteine-specific translation elongation factor [Synergistaceae bacterium]
MEGREISLVLGTAGHIDHGKTTLVKALTGLDCDRLREEKKRGITIELGFAPLKLEDGRIVSIVDVPGHERFIRQMVAGASGIDAVLLVIAADEGVMPQTREHLEILSLLGVRDGLVAVTKTDGVDEDFLELVFEDIEEFLTGTFLEGKMVVPVSAFSGENIPLLLKELTLLVDRVPPRSRKGPFFLPVDRAFPVAGFGTVVTGTGYRGELSVGQEGVLLPSRVEGRIRSLQVHSSAVQTAWAGQRMAVSIAGVSAEDLGRGDVLCEKGIYAPTTCFECELRLLESAPSPLKHWQRVRLHIGTSDVTARIALLENPLVQPGETVPAQIVAEEELVCLLNQRFVLRRYSPLETIAGGRVLFPYAVKPRGKAARKICATRVRSLADATSSEERLSVLVDSFEMLDLDDAVRFLQEQPQEILRLGERLAFQKSALFLSGERKVFLSLRKTRRLEEKVAVYLEDFHASQPSRRGAPADEMALSVLKEFDSRTARSFLGSMAREGAILLFEGMAALADFIPRDDEAFARNSQKILSLCREKEFQPPLIGEVRETLGLDEKRFSLLLKGMRETGMLSLVAGEFLFAREIEERLLSLLLTEKNDISVARIRDLTGSSRKFILPLLEYLDSKGYTRRVGDKRVLLASRLPDHLLEG